MAMEKSNLPIKKKCSKLRKEMNKTLFFIVVILAFAMWFLLQKCHKNTRILQICVTLECQGLSDFSHINI